MRIKTALAGLLGAALACTGARAATSARDEVRLLAGLLQAGAPALGASNDAPLLGGQLTALAGGLRDMVREGTLAGERARPVADAAAGLAGEVGRAPKPLGEAFCRAAAQKVRTIAGDALALAADAAPGAPAVYAPDFSPAAPPPEPGAAAGLRRRDRAMGAVMGRTDFDGSAAAPSPREAAVLPPAPAPLPRLSAARRLTAYQGALRSYLKALHRRPLEPDGIAGPGTSKAVSYFQKKHGLRATGTVDEATASALLSNYQARRGLPVTGRLDEATVAALAKGDPPVYFAGKPEDFEPTAKATTIRKVRATVYTPYLAKTRKERKMEGPPVDRHAQTVCTVERYLGGACPYVSVAIDQRLKVPNGTPLLIPEISALVGRKVPFRIVDTGSKKFFRGARHIDIATDSDQYSGIGRLISGGRFTLVLPRGLPSGGPAAAKGGRRKRPRARGRGRGKASAS